MRTPDELQAALVALEAALPFGEDALLGALLSVWALNKNPHIARAIDALSPRFGQRIAPIEDASGWHTVASRRDPSLVPALLAAPWSRDRPSILRKKLSVLADFPPDPRIAAFVDELLLHYEGHRPGGRDVLLLANVLREQHGPIIETDAPSGGLLAEILVNIQQRQDLGNALLLAVIASPDDDGPRLVYADYLIERNDPLGDYIVRSIRGETPVLDRAQLERFCRALLGGGVVPSSVTFRRGFPHELTMYQGKRPSTAGPLWTLEKVHLIAPNHVALAWLPSLWVVPNLHTLWVEPRYAGEGIDPEHWSAAALPSVLTQKIRELGSSVAAWQRPRNEAAQWPVLERLILWVVGDVVLDFSSLDTILRPIELVLLASAQIAWAVASAVRVAEQGPVGIRRIIVRESYPTVGIWPTLVLDRDQDQRLLDAKLLVSRRALESLTEFLKYIDGGSFSAVTVTCEDPKDRAFCSRVRTVLNPRRGVKIRFEAR